MSSTESGYKIPEKMYRKFPEESKKLLETIVQFIEPKTGETIVDVGTGAGFLALELAEKVGKNGKVIGLDISEQAIREARRVTARNQHQQPQFKIGDVHNLPFEDDFADAVCCKSLLCSIDHRQKAVREMARVAKHGGRIVAVEPGELVGLPTGIKRAYYVAVQGRSLTERGLRDLFQTAGLSSVEVLVKEPSEVTDVSMFEWTTENLFGERPLWELALKGGIKEDQVRLVHEKLTEQIKTAGLKFGTPAIFCKGTKP
jgi:ubiquinone/menaquinone biosynthesis C-methylase UbiE